MSKRTYKRNTSKSITVNYNPVNGVAGVKLLFTVKATKFDASDTDATAIIKQTVDMVGTTGVINLTPSTVAKTVAPGKYFFDISVRDVSGNIYSVDSGQFELLANVTNREA